MYCDCRIQFKSFSLCVFLKQSHFLPNSYSVLQKVKINGAISTIPLSTEGVVNHCILEATDFDKLASMYVGWGAYL